MQWQSKGMAYNISGCTARLQFSPSPYIQIPGITRNCAKAVTLSAWSLYSYSLLMLGLLAAGWALSSKESCVNRLTTSSNSSLSAKDRLCNEWGYSGNVSFAAASKNVLKSRRKKMCAILYLIRACFWVSCYLLLMKHWAKLTLKKSKDGGTQDAHIRNRDYHPAAIRTQNKSKLIVALSYPFIGVALRLVFSMSFSSSVL